MDRSTLLTVGAVVVAFFLFGQAIRNAVAGDFVIAAIEATLGALVLVAARSL